MKGTNNMEKKSIGAFIAILRKVSGMTQKDLAEKLGVSDKTVSHWERDESAPDLTLIPVIAEIFGVTCDELLRGERIKNASEEAVKEPSGKTEKQLKYLLGRGREKFMTRSMIALGLSILGLLAAFICNFAFTRGYLGFLIGCIFWAAAAVCESVFVSHAFTAVGDDFNGDELNDYKIYVVRLAEKVFSAATVMFAVSLPLIIVTGDGYQGVTVGVWGWGLIILFTAAAAVACMFIAHLVNNSLLRKGVYKLIKSADIQRHATGRLKARCTVITLAVLITISLGQTVFNRAVWPENFAAGITFNNFEDFKAYMETEKESQAYIGNAAPQLVPGGVEVTCEPAYIEISGSESESDEIYYDQYGNVITKEEALTEYIYDDAGNAAYKFIRLNGEVETYRYNGAGTDEFSVTVYTYEDLMSGEASISLINARISSLYFIAAGAGLLIYFIKKSKLKRSL